MPAIYSAVFSTISGLLVAAFCIAIHTQRAFVKGAETMGKLHLFQGSGMIGLYIIVILV